MLKNLNMNDLLTVRKILKLQRRSYAVEAELLGTAELPPLKESEQSLQRCGETFVGYMENERLAGLISYKEREDRLAVDPDFFRQGIAGRLLNDVLSLHGIRCWVVSTGKANHPAVRCYQKHGFRITGESRTDEGIEIIHLKRDGSIDG
ncbi:GNAT family N-acetyltransferase [Lihuaxuella thermophila]|uniref:Acetyltransferase (GNAT) domain-containing protein n=1 Tax=Lihuaxuella thermophila TaxID=1173111 RepID=A0A1H8DGV8_9BACL|nr:GNAT family N-acetyltransferase [Lihuaxuella thermophila]SEN05707.1 Acetyltransferase (GNAT) domain-containing protein [Lihuaxuella thermophila]